MVEFTRSAESVITVEVQMLRGVGVAGNGIEIRSTGEEFEQIPTIRRSHPGGISNVGFKRRMHADEDERFI